MDDQHYRSPLKRRHQMPFGAELTAGGTVRFRLWAPAARGVELLLYEGGTTRAEPLAALPGGWFALESSAARAGSLYRYRINGGQEVPDPASRFNPEGVHGPSQVVDPGAFTWTDTAWRTPPWHTSVVYELHIGTFEAPGTYAAVAARFPHLARLGVSAIELMPVAAFPGARGWGYDGVLPYAPHGAYGRPEDLKAFVAAAHGAGLAVILDVVYNHFGPEGNYLHLYAPQFFNRERHTPWGAAINFDGAGSRTVRDFFVHNALYWLEEYHFDGLRLDAIHAVHDTSPTHLASELARDARAAAGRSVYLTLENFDNAARLLGAEGAAASCDAQWNDDVHHCLHVLLTGESAGYYGDYCAQPRSLLCRALAQGFAYQGERSRLLDAPRGEPSGHLPPTAFIDFLQNHDQVGNRARAERLTQLVRDPAALRAASVLLLLAPHPPLLFMGEEWAAPEPFPWFCDFEPQLQESVRVSREQEFPGSADPGAPATFAAARLDWSRLRERRHARVLREYRRLLALRRRVIVPLLPRMRAARCVQAADLNAFAVEWSSDEATLRLLANLSAQRSRLPAPAAGRVVFATHPGIRRLRAAGELPPWSVLWLLERPR